MRPKTKKQLLMERVAVLSDALKESGLDVEISPTHAWFNVRYPETFTRQVGNKTISGFVKWLAHIDVHEDGRIHVSPVSGGISSTRTNEFGEAVERTKQEAVQDAKLVFDLLAKKGLREWLVLWPG